MKRIIFLFACLAALAPAQGQRTVTETFDNNRFQWEEFFEKDYSGSIQDGYFILKNDRNGALAQSVTELPINIDMNFKVIFKFSIPKLNDSYYFGVIFNYEDENNYSNFLVSEKKFKLSNRVNGTNSISRQNSIILKSGKNRDVSIEMEKKGPKLTFRVDNMDAVSVTKKLNFNTFGFQVENANTIKIDEVSIEQRTEE
jgi:hypothetical protein